MPKQEKADKINSTIGGFTGSETFTRWSPLYRTRVLTEGVKFVANTANAYWLMDVIGSYQQEAAFKSEDFQVRKIVTDLEKGTCVVTCTDGDKGNGPVTLCKQRIPSTDFPLAEFTPWAERNELVGVTILLPSEH